MPCNLFIDGFDKYGPVNWVDFSGTVMAGDWASLTSGTLVTPLSAQGQAISIASGGSTVSNTFSSVSRIVGTVRVRTAASGNAGFITLRNGATAAFTIMWNNTTGLQIRTGNTAGTVIASGGTIPANTTFVTTFDVTVGASAAFKVLADGGVVLDSTVTGNGNTGNGQSTVNTVVIGGVTAGSCIFDDLVLQDPTNAAYNSAILTNLAVVETQFANGDAQTQFTNDGDIQWAANTATTGPYRDTLSATGAAPGADTLYLIRIVAPVNTTLNSISGISLGNSATVKNKGVVYSDSAGNPNVLLSSGTEVVGQSANTVYTSPLITPQSLVAGTAYWIGFITDTAVNLWRVTGFTLGQQKANTYTSGAPAGPLTGMTTGRSVWTIFGNCTGAGVNWTATFRVPPLSTAASQVHSNTVGQEDLLTFPALVTTPSIIYGAAVKALAVKSDAGSRSISLNMKSGSSDSTGSNATQALSTTRMWYGSMFDTDPATGLAWTQSGVNAASSGYSVAA